MVLTPCFPTLWTCVSTAGSRAFGISASHDAKPPHFIAQASRGMYSFINDNQDSITSTLAGCWGGLKTVVAAHTRIKLTATEQVGVEIRSIQSGGYQKHVSSDRRWGEIVLDVMYTGEVKNFIVRLCASGMNHLCHWSSSAGAAYAGHWWQLIWPRYGNETGNNPVVLHIQRPSVVADAGRQDPSPAVVSRIVLFEPVQCWRFLSTSFRPQ